MVATVGSRAEIQGFEGKTPLSNMAQTFSNLPFFISIELHFIPLQARDVVVVAVSD